MLEAFKHPEARRVYLDASATVFALVSEEDYAWAIQWKWHFIFDRHKRKKYAKRNTRRRGETTQQLALFLHKEILLERMKEPQPTNAHTIGEHGDGNSLNCQRWNLSWATPSMNRRTARAPVRRAA